MKQAIDHIRERIGQAAARSGRLPSTVTLIGVSKTHPAELVREAYAAGIRQFGENRVQEAESKISACSDLADIEWHLIGHLQRNKAKKAAQLFAVIHSVDSLELAQALSRHAVELNRTPIRILLQCNVSGEASKEGIAAVGWEENAPMRTEIIALAQTVAALPGLTLVGLMTVAPYSDDQEAVRSVFHSLRSLRDVLQAALPDERLTELSMGMSGDIDVAIAEGATMVRVGRALFGERSYPAV
jgi:pyridoxal phosphate enzyme (YggS family)